MSVGIELKPITIMPKTYFVDHLKEINKSNITMTKQLSLKLILTILISMVSMKAFSYDALIDGIYYNFDGNEAIVTFREYAEKTAEHILNDVNNQPSICFTKDFLSSALKNDEPETKTSAPFFLQVSPVSRFIPPSTSR